MRRIAFTSLAVFAFMFVLSDKARGCECPPSPEKPSPEEASAAWVKSFNGASAIFSGEVVKADILKVKFKVERSWKGSVGKEIVMSTGAKKYEDGAYSISSCDYNFKLGEEYLVYAYPVDPNLHPGSPDLQAHQCTRTKLLKHAQPDIEMLEQLLAGSLAKPSTGDRERVRQLWVF